MSTIPVFRFDSILAESDLCNYEIEKKTFTSELSSGKKLVLFGRRNTGKTSLIKSCVIPRLRKMGYFVVFADFYGVRSLAHIRARLQTGFQRSLVETFHKKSQFLQIITALKTLRPVIKTDPTDGLSLSFEPSESSLPSLEQLIDGILKVQKKTKCVLVFDEFQDICFVEQAEGLIRNELQNLPYSVGILMLGSKKHLLSKIFAHPTSPLAGFGEDRELRPIPFEEYHRYMLERFQPQDLSIDLESATWLQEELQRIPEAINIVCAQIIHMYSGKVNKVAKEHAQKAILEAVSSRTSRYEEFLNQFTDGEQAVMRSVAKLHVTAQPSGTDFVKTVGISQKGVSKIVKKLENEAILYKVQEGYILNDPLLEIFLRVID